MATRLFQKILNSRSGSNNKKPAHRAALLYVVLAAATAPLAQATEVPGLVNDTTITNEALSNIKGIIGVNQAAGDLNLQANVRAINATDHGLGLATISQTSSLRSATGATLSTTRIKESAFNNATGLLSINQASGAGNLEANSIVIAPELAPQTVSDDLLAQTALDVDAAGTQEKNRRSDGRRVVEVDETAFRGMRGVLQLNQAAGMHNVTRNRVIMQTR